MAYSMDLKFRVLAALDDGQPVASVACRFGLSGRKRETEPRALCQTMNGAFADLESSRDRDDRLATPDPGDHTLTQLQ